MNPETTLKMLSDLYDANTKLNQLLAQANDQTAKANTEIDRLTKVIENLKGPELPLGGAGGGNHGDKLVAVGNGHAFQTEAFQ